MSKDESIQYRSLTVRDQVNDFLLYSDGTGKTTVEVLLNEDTLWLNQQQIAELFAVGKAAISKHFKNIFSANELDENSVVSILETTANDGKIYQVKYYNLDAIISVGYRVNSSQATAFRIWATKQLKELIIKGFVMDDERLKNGRHFGQDYFKELLERVRSIRASERRIYQQITDIFAECTIDYQKDADITRQFYALVQNKFHFAITGQTAAEIIHQKADHQAENMGLTTWKNSPDGRILQSDVVIAKNYLQEDEIKRLERTITGFFDYIENIIENRTEITMKSMQESVDKFLNFNEFRVLEGFGKMKKSVADKKAKAEYEIFNKTQRIHSDFDRLIEQTKRK